MANETHEAEASKVKVLSKEELRAQIFSKDKTALKRITLPFNGVDLEFRQPSVNQALEMQESDDGRNYLIKTIINYTFVPGTDEKVFGLEDYETIANMPMGSGFQEAVKAIMEVMDIKVEDKVKN